MLGVSCALVSGVAVAQPVAAAAVVPAASVLRVRWRAGQQARYQIVTTQTIEPTSPGRAAPPLQTEAEVVVSTRSVTPAGTATQHVELASVRLGSEVLPPGTRSPLTQSLRAARVTYTQTSRGAVEGDGPRVEGVSDAMRPRVQGMLSALQQLGPTLPEGPVRVGDAWDERAETRLSLGPGAEVVLAIVRRNTLHSLRQAPLGPVAEIDTTLTLSTPQGSALGQIPMRGEGAGQGRLTFDLGRAVLVQSRVQGTMAVHLTVRGRDLTVRSRFDNTLALVPEGAEAGAGAAARPGRPRRGRRGP